MTAATPKTRTKAPKPLSAALETSRKHLGAQKQEAGDTSKQGDDPHNTAPKKLGRPPKAAQAQEGAPPATTKPKTPAKPKQAQSKLPTKDDVKPIGDDSTDKVIDNAGGGSGGIEGGQQQDAGDTSKQGDEVINLTEVGQKQMLGNVEIAYARAPARGAEPAPEKYPFSKLGYGKIVDKNIEGPSFFIPESDNPEKHLTNARKPVPKHGSEPAWLYSARSVREEFDGEQGVPGKRIWRLKNEKYKGK